MKPQIQYAKASDGISIAYYVIGQGPATLYLSLPHSHLEFEWQVPEMRAAFTSAAQNGRFVRLDFRASGSPTARSKTYRSPRW
jgi:hypothetical protein